MSTSPTRTPLSWSSRLLIGLVLILAGAAAMTWFLARSPRMARIMGVNPPLSTDYLPQAVAVTKVARPAPSVTSQPKSQLEAFERRLTKVEDTTRNAEGSLGRADGLVVAFAARRAIDRGVALGYLERLLADRFGANHQAAVATVITAARKPVRLNDLAVRYDQLAPELRRGDPNEGWLAGLARELGTVVQVRRADRPSPSANARYERARQALLLGDVDEALAETMRMPGAANATSWTRDARRYIAAQRALDELESAALLGGGRAS